MSLFLEAQSEGRGAWRQPVRPLPFRVGRRETSHLRLVSPSISGEHAILMADDDGQLFVEDLGSTNGTFVNLRRVRERTAVHVGDVLHFADQEFRLQGVEGAGMRSTAAVEPGVLDAMRGLVARRSSLEEAIAQRSFDVLFQPIVDLRSQQVVGHEALTGAGGAFINTDEMFSEAHRLSLSLDLSEIVREITADRIQELSGGGLLFINTHPDELAKAPRLLQSLDRFKARSEGFRLVVEIHEMAVTDVNEFLGFREELEARDIALAFDDFGRGQSRFLELAELRPDYVKFDRAVISSERELTPKRTSMIETLVRMVHEMGASVLAEGIETPEELRMCRELEFDLGQGYLLGRPKPPDEPPTVTGPTL